MEKLKRNKSSGTFSKASRKLGTIKLEQPKQYTKKYDITHFSEISFPRESRPLSQVRRKEPDPKLKLLHNPVINNFGHQEDYSIVEPLPISFLATEEPDKNLNVVMRNDQEQRLKQRTCVDLGQLCMVSKLHICGQARYSKFNIWISQSPHDDFNRVQWQKSTYYRDKGERVITFGNLPGRFLRFELISGVPLPRNSSALTVYGVRDHHLEAAMGKGAWELLFDKTYQIIYNFGQQDKGYKAQKADKVPAWKFTA